MLEFHNVHRRFDPDTPVLSGITFDVDKGQVVGLLGRNGSGKTTLINIVMGMLAPQTGSVRLFDRDPRVDPVAVKRRIGFVSEDQVLPAGMRVDGVIAFHRELFSTWDGTLEEHLRERFRFDGRARVKTLSKGQARQLALLCAVAHRPELLILDEPAGSLDPVTRREFLETSIQLLAESGSTILFSSHHMGDVERMAERFVLIDDHRVLLNENLEDVQERFGLVVLPADGIDTHRLTAIEGILRARKHHGRLHCVFEGDQGEIAARLAADLGISDAHFVRIPLEELFVELLGDPS